MVVTHRVFKEKREQKRLRKHLFFSSFNLMLKACATNVLIVGSVRGFTPLDIVYIFIYLVL